MRAFLLVAIVAALACPSAAGAGGLAGRVLSASAVPVVRALVTAQRIELGRANGLGVTVETNRDGAFELRDLVTGLYAVTFRAEGYTATRLRVEVPISFSIQLPPIRMSAASYARARFVSAAGSPMHVTRIVGRSFDLQGAPLSDARDEWTPTPAGADGTVTIGPLPRGITMLGVDLLGFARTRLPDIRVSGTDPIVDVGTIVLARGTALRIRVGDASGAAQERVRVSVVDTAVLTPFQILPVHTDATGTATFDRLGPGTYRLMADGDEPCGTATPAAERVVALSADGTREERLVIGGARVALQVLQQGMPLVGIPVVLEPERAKRRWPAWWRPSSSSAGLMPPYVDRSRSRCSGSTDAEGRLALSNVPFGPTRVTVHLSNASWSRVESIPIRGRAVRVDISGQAVSARVLRSDTGAPVPAADVGWDSGGVTVRARTSAAGDVLLDGVPPGAGTLSVTIPGFRPLERDLSAPPEVPLDMRLTPIAPPFVVVRVSDPVGTPIVNAAVYLDFQDAAEDDQAAPTDPDGVARFNVRRPNAVCVTAWASGYARTSISAMLREEADDAIAIRLPRGQPRP